MMISISVAIASDYLAGNFAAWGRGSSRELKRPVRKGVERKKETEGEREWVLVINKLWNYGKFATQSHQGTGHKLT